MVMTPEKVSQLMVSYRAKLDELCPAIVPKQFDEESSFALAHELKSATRVAHYKFMCVEIPRLMEAGTVDKAMRWLGFLQGVMWRRNLFTLNELKEQSRS